MKIVFVGRYNHEKGLKYLIEAASKLKKDQFYLIGYGPLEDELKKLAEGMENVHFLGAIRHDLLIKKLKEYDLFIYPSLTEGLGFSVIEFCHLGKPAIVTSVGGLPETIGYGKGGIIIPPRDPKAIVTAINKLRNVKLRRKLGYQAKKFVDKEFNKGYWILKFKKLVGENILYIDISEKVDYLRPQLKIIKENTKTCYIITKGKIRNRVLYMCKVFFEGFYILTKNKEMDIISCRTDYLAPPAIVLGKIFKRKIYGELFTFPIEYERIRGTSRIKRWLLERFLRIFTPRFDAVIVCSKALLKEARSYGAKKIFYLPYWLDF